MRILWLGHFVPWPPKGGSLIRSYYLLREAAATNDVALLCLNQRALLPTAERLDEAKRALMEHCASVSILPIPAEQGYRVRERTILRSTISGRAYDESWFASAALASRLEELVRTFEPHVIHFDTVGLAPYSKYVPGRPLILNHHNIESHMMMRRAAQEPSWFVRALLRLHARRLARLERSTAARVGTHLTVSDLDRHRLLSLVPSARVEVVPNGVDLDYFRPVPIDRVFVPRSIVIAGGLTWYPNRKAVTWLLDQILPRLRARYPDVAVTIVGKEPPPEFLALGARDPRLTFTGFVDDIRPHVARAAVYVCPILDGGGTRLKILDTLSQRVPLVATSMAVEGIGVENGVHALLADDAEGFAHAVGSLFDDPEEGFRLASAGRTLVEERYGWGRIGSRLRAVYLAEASSVVASLEARPAYDLARTERP